MDLHISLDEPGSLTGSIYQQLRDAILDGLLPTGSSLPSSRELARQLAVSRNTVAGAYDRLTAEGFLSGRVGAGTFVSAADVLPAQRRGAPDGALHPLPMWAQGPEESMPTVTFDFRLGVPDVTLFPAATWRRLVGAQLHTLIEDVVDYGEPAGVPACRAAVARHIALSRAVRATPDEIILTQGAQQAFDLIGRVLVEPGTCVAVEEPGYPPVRQLFRSHGAQVVGVPVDEEGIVVDALPAAAKLIYVTPSHQFPLGVTMSPSRRTALLEWAERHDAAIVEDDYDSEFRFSERPLDPLQSLDRIGRVIYVGSFSKSLLPTLRLGFLVAPASMRPALVAAKQLTDRHGDRAAQAALAVFINEGLLSRHLRRAQRVYSARREEILHVLRHRLSEHLALVPSAAGIHVCARALGGVDVEAVALRARQAGVGVRTLGSFCADGPHESGLVLGYGAIPDDQVREGLRRLVDAFPTQPGVRGG